MCQWQLHIWPAAIIRTNVPHVVVNYAADRVSSQPTSGSGRANICVEQTQRDNGIYIYIHTYIYVYGVKGYLCIHTYVYMRQLIQWGSPSWTQMNKQTWLYTYLLRNAFICTCVSTSANLVDMWGWASGTFTPEYVANISPLHICLMMPLMSPSQHLSLPLYSGCSCPTLFNQWVIYDYKCAFAHTYIHMQVR